jgi:hypothetical protein
LGGIAFLTILLFTLGSCSAALTEATITKKNGRSYSAILSNESNADSIVYFDGERNKRAVRRSDVADIDHPGNVVGVIGSALAVATLPLCAILLSDAVNKSAMNGTVAADCAAVVAGGVGAAARAHHLRQLRPPVVSVRCSVPSIYSRGTTEARCPKHDA